MSQLEIWVRGSRRVLAAALLAGLAACGGGKSDTGEVSVGEATSEPQVEQPEAAETSAGGSVPFATSGQMFAATPCASEGGQCSFSDERSVAFGANGKYIVKTFTGGVPCNKATFGDAASGTLRQCFLALLIAAAQAHVPASGASAPTPPPSTPPTTPPPATPPTAPTTPPATPPASPPVDPGARPSKPEAARFLVQSTFGPNLTEIDRLAGMGYGSWLDQQFSTAPMDTYWNYLHRGGPIGCTVCNSGNVNTVMEAFWQQAVRGPDQLRQRTVLALSEIFVVSTVNTWIASLPTAYAGYLDMLSANAFGNFRTLLEQMALHPSMGAYLSHLKNEKEDTASGRLPDENFAREVMQLFTIGLWELNEDGSRRKDASGNDIPTYGQAEIMGMAKVFTGWGWGNGDWGSGFTGANPKDPYERAFDRPMIAYADHHSPSEKRILRGVVIPAGTPAPQSMKIALDTLFNHPNVGPFIGSQLIKRMVTSNPSPAYVRRVTLAFNDNGRGVRGDMKAVLRAVLLDPEARDMAKLENPQWGKLREPLVRYANFLRAFNAKSTGGIYKIWNLEDPLSSIGQNPLRAPSVFNWFRPDYAPPGAVSGQALVAPEFQITHETTTTGYANFIATIAERQNSWYRDNIVYKYGPTTDYLAADYSAEVALARDPNALLDRLNLLLMSGQMSAATRRSILEAVNATPVDANGGTTRVAFAVYLIMLSPEYIVQK